MSPRSNRYRSSYCAKNWSREKQQQQQQQQQNKQKTKGGKGKVTGEATWFPGSSPTGRGAWERGWGRRRKPFLHPPPSFIFSALVPATRINSSRNSCYAFNRGPVLVKFFFTLHERCSDNKTVLFSLAFLCFCGYCPSSGKDYILDGSFFFFDPVKSEFPSKKEKFEFRS